MAGWPVRRLGITTLYVTHDQIEALSMSNVIAVMSAGRLVAQGNWDELASVESGPFVAHLGPKHRVDRVLREWSAPGWPDAATLASRPTGDDRCSRLYPWPVTAACLRPHAFTPSRNTAIA